MGLYETEGEVRVYGKPLDLSKLGEALRNKIAFVSEDRRGVGLLLGESIERNIIFSAMQINDEFLKRIGPIKILDKANADKHAKNMITARYSLHRNFTGGGSLSGVTNKSLLARATMHPRF